MGTLAFLNAASEASDLTRFLRPLQSFTLVLDAYKRSCWLRLSLQEVAM